MCDFQADYIAQISANILLLTYVQDIFTIQIHGIKMKFELQVYGSNELKSSHFDFFV